MLYPTNAFNCTVFINDYMYVSIYTVDIHGSDISNHYSVDKEILENNITNSVLWPISEKVSKDLFTSPLPSHLMCEICLDILSDPV